MLASTDWPNEFNCQGIKNVECDVVLVSKIVKSKCPHCLDGLNMAYLLFQPQVKIREYYLHSGENAFNTSRYYFQNWVHFNSCFYAHICEITTINHEFFTWGMLTPKVSVKVIYGVHEYDFNVSSFSLTFRKV